MLPKPPPIALTGDPDGRNYQSDKFEWGSLTTITLYHDMLCPWCWVGFFHAQKLTQEFSVTFDWRGAELIPPGMAYEPGPPKPAPDPNAPPPPSVQALREPPTPTPASRFDLFAEAEGIAMPSPRPPFARTHHALLGGEWANAQGPEVFDVYNEAVYRAFWEKRANIAEVSVLGEIAASVGLDAVALQESIKSGQYENNIIPFDDDAYAMGIRHVPTFLFNAEEKLAEAPYADLARATERFLIRAEKFRAKTA